MFSATISADCEAAVAGLGARLGPLSGSRILVTGAGGFLCSYVVDVIAKWNETSAQRPCHITALDNLTTGSWQRLSHLAGRDDVDLVEHDITQPLDPSLKPDWIIHGASIASPTIYRRHPLKTLDANIGGTRNVLEAARANRSTGVLVMSSSEIYGDPDPTHIPTDETYLGNVASIGPRACYDESKRVAETLSFIYSSYFDVPVRAIRPFNVFGPGQNLKDGRIIPDMMSNVLDGNSITLFSDGQATRSFCYVTDAVQAMLALMVAPDIDAIAFNVGNDEVEVSIRDLAEVMCEIASDVAGHKTCAVEFARSDDENYTVDNPQRRCPDLSRIRQAVGYVPKVGLREGLSRTLRSYLELR